jgi:putative ABC transport system ATP-binding protein
MENCNNRSIGGYEMIKIQNLNKIYNENKPNQFYALKNINLEVKKGELLILKGVSGSGKSSLLSIISTLSKPTSGTLLVKNEQVARMSDLHTSSFRINHIGFVAQSFNLFDNLNVEQNVQTALVPLNLSQDLIEQKVTKALKLANIEHKRTQVVNLLSGGEKQRCAIARALVNDPEILLCDEPTANLDKSNSTKFLQIIKELNSIGKTILIATHDSLFDNLDFKHTLVNIDDGMIVA